MEWFFDHSIFMRNIWEKRKTFSPFNDKMGLSDKNNGMITGKAEQYGKF